MGLRIWPVLIICLCSPSVVLGQQEKECTGSSDAILLQVSTFPFSAAGHRTAPSLPIAPKHGPENLVVSLEQPFHWGDWHDWFHVVVSVPPWSTKGNILSLMACQQRSSGFLIATGVAVFVVALLAILAGIFFGCTKSFEKAVAAQIQSSAHLDVDIEDIKFYPLGAFIEVRGLLIKNPEPFKNDEEHFFLKAGLLRLDIAMRKLLWSIGKDIHIDEVTAANMEVIIEYAGYFGGESNIHAIMEKIKGDKDDASTAAEIQKETTDSEDPKEKDKATSPVKVTLHKVCFEDIGMKLATKIAGAHVSAGDVKYDDFAEEVGESMVDDILLVIIKSISKTILEHMAGQNFANRFF